LFKRGFFTDFSLGLKSVMALQQKDLLKENKRLMDIVQKQSFSIKTMEKRYPGISKVKRNPGSAIIIDENIE